VRALELFSNSHTGRTKGSLFGLLNHTKTTVGARLLRSNLASPLCDARTLNARLDCVEVFIKNAKILGDTGLSLARLVDLDSILAQVSNTK
jgi:DNA mismatch repair ATPase MutS